MDQLSLFTPLSLTVSDLTRYVRQLLESDDVLQDVWVLGEISNLSRPKSGHVYFTLKDEYASLRCVVWRSTAVRLTIGLENGMAIEAYGSIGVYEQGGQYQLYVNSVRLAGEGLLFQEYLRLKSQLESEGLFDPERKRPIPAYPHHIGIVTSPTGAALQDMLNTLRVRYPLAEVILAPTAVQGEQAPQEITTVIQALNRLENLDVILIARGGGSLEDLWAFNDEQVTRSIASSRIPIITGIGHETDFTLADFAADLRAPTPTGAAVLATPDVADLKYSLIETANHHIRTYKSILRYQDERLRETHSRLQKATPLRRIQDNQQHLDNLSARTQWIINHRMQLLRTRWEGINNRLLTINPTAVLRRGFSVVSQTDGIVIRSVKQVRAGLVINVRVADGKYNARVEDDHNSSLNSSSEYS